MNLLFKIGCILLIAYVTTGCSKDKLLPKEKIYQLCWDTYKQSGTEMESRIRIAPSPDHPITLDSFRLGKTHAIWMNDSLKLINKAGARLENRIFWRILCWEKDMMDSGCEIYIDARSGEILYVDGMSAKRWWKPLKLKE